MKATRIIRRIDDLGRVVIPKEIRRTCHIIEGEPLEIFIDQIDGISYVCLRKYQDNFYHEVISIADRIDEEMMGYVTNEQRSEVCKHFNEITKILKEWGK